jgi:hypothetical protein
MERIPLDLGRISGDGSLAVQAEVVLGVVKPFVPDDGWMGARLSFDGRECQTRRNRAAIGGEVHPRTDLSIFQPEAF